MRALLAFAHPPVGPIAKQADPGLGSISRDLKVEPRLLTELPVLVGVLALELGSALGLVPVQAVSGSKSAMGQKRRFRDVRNMSGQRVIPDMLVSSRYRPD